MTTATADDFARAYAERSGVTVEWFRDSGREAMPCDCDGEPVGLLVEHGTGGTK